MGFIKATRRRARPEGSCGGLEWTLSVRRIPAPSASTPKTFGKGATQEVDSIAMDWASLWRKLVEQFDTESAYGESGLLARWGKRSSRAGYTRERRERDRDDPLMQFVLGNLRPENTVLDIGAGIGRWSIPMSMKASSVTALDALPGMLEVIQQNASDEGVSNIQTVQGDWATLELEAHDYTISSHAAYSSPDIAAYARKMERHSREACYIVMRVPKHDGVIGDLSRRIHGCWHDSPNFIVGYNALLQSGINGHVIMEESVRHWHNARLDEALERAKRHLRLHDERHDGTIMDTLERRLVPRDGRYWWPDGMRSALVWWRPGS